MLRQVVGLLVTTMLLGCQTLQFPESSDLSEHTRRVDRDVMLAGTLKPAVLNQLQHADTVVVDLRAASEGAAVEGRQMAAAGVTWINLPQGRGVPTHEDVALLAAILDANQGRPLVLHCATGNRAGKLWAAYRLEQGVALETALAEVEALVTFPEVEAAIREYVPLEK